MGKLMDAQLGRKDTLTLAVLQLRTYAQYNSIYGAIDNKQVAEYC